MTRLLKLWKSLYLGDIIGARRGVFDGSVTKTRSGWFKLRDIVPFMANGGLPAGEKGRSYSACVNSVIMYESQI